MEYPPDKHWKVEDYAVRACVVIAMGSSKCVPGIATHTHTFLDLALTALLELRKQKKQERSNLGAS